MIVVDANVIAYLLLRGERSEASDRLLEAHPDWVAPHLWRDEFLNVLCTHERQGMLTAQKTFDLLTDAMMLMEGRSYDLPPHRVLAVARRTGCTGYDSQYIALAEELGVPLYTHDRKVLLACLGLAMQPE